MRTVLQKIRPLVKGVATKNEKESETGMISRDFLAQRVFDMTKERLISQYNNEQIWEAIAKTSDDNLYKIYSKLVNK